VTPSGSTDEAEAKTAAADKSAGSAAEPDARIGADAAQREAEGGSALAHPTNPTTLLVTLACVVIIIAGMRYAADILNPILLALFVVMGLSPVLNWLRRRGVPSWLTMAIVLVGFLAVAGVFVGTLASYVGQLDSRLIVYQENLGTIMDDASAWLAARGIDTSGLLSDMLTPERIMGWVSSVLTTTVDAFGNIVLMVFIVIFMLSQVYTFPGKMYQRLQLSKRFEHGFREFGDVTRSYIFTKGWLAAIAAVVSTAVYFAFGVDFALLWGLLFFALSFIPNIGFVISVIPPFFVTLLETGLLRAVLVVVTIVILNTIVDNMLAPRFMGRSVGLSTLAVFLSLVVWAWILGPVGALISIPLTLMVKLLFFDSYESTRSLSLFLTGGTKTVRTRKAAPPSKS
jgi:AI-2 transport protein TqsA